MKTDNKEEAKRLVQSHQVLITDKFDLTHKCLLIDDVYLLLEQISQDRFHPETFERVVKPSKKLMLKYGEVYYEIQLKKWNDNTLTLDQLIERCKEMRELKGKNKTLVELGLKIEGKRIQSQKELERLKEGYRDLAEGFKDRINERTFNSIMKQTK